MPSNVNAGKKGSNAAKKPAARKPSASRSRTPNKMAGRSLGEVRGAAGRGMAPQQGQGGWQGLGGGMGGGGGWQGLQQQPGFNPGGNAFGNAMAARGGWQGLGGMTRAPVGPQGGGPMFGGGQVPQLEGGGGFRPLMGGPQMSQPFTPPMGNGMGQMQQRPMFNGPSAGIGGGYGNMFGGPSAGGTQTMAQRPMGGGGMQQPGMGSFQTQAPVGPQGPTSFGGGPTAPRPTPQISQPFTPPPSGPQQPFTRGPGQMTY